MSQRVQAVVVTLFLLILVGVVGLLLTRIDRDAASRSSPTRASSTDLDSASQDPVGGVSLTAGEGDIVLRVMAGSCRLAGGPKLELSKSQAAPSIRSEFSRSATARASARRRPPCARSSGRKGPPSTS